MGYQNPTPGQILQGYYFSEPTARDWKPVTKLDHYELRASQLRKGKDAGRDGAGR